MRSLDKNYGNENPKIYKLKIAEVVFGRCNVTISRWPFSHFPSVPSPSARLAVVFALKGKPWDFMAWFGIKCCTWVSINSGTSLRSICSSVGDTAKKAVMQGNSMLERKGSEDDATN